MTSEELDTVAAMLLGQTPIWPPKEGGVGETVTVEGTLFTPQCDSLAVNLASLRREALVYAVWSAALIAGYVTLLLSLSRWSDLQVMLTSHECEARAHREQEPLQMAQQAALQIALMRFIA